MAIRRTTNPLEQAEGLKNRSRRREEADFCNKSKSAYQQTNLLTPALSSRGGEGEDSGRVRWQADFGGESRSASSRRRLRGVGRFLSVISALCGRGVPGHHKCRIRL